MKKLLYLSIIASLFIGCDDDDTPEPSKNPVIETVSLSTGADYANDIYYSLRNGVVATESRTEWDIAVYTKPRSSSILTNDGNGIALYVVDEIANWESVTETPTGAALFNTYSDTTWENGAFDKGVYGDWDYGWGYYDMITHTVTGDSVHVIILADGTPKKLIIEKREASANTFHIKYANLDGSEETSDIINCGDYADKNMIHYSIKNKSVVEHEPAKHEWDLMFTKYYDESIPYKVTGILSNNDILIAELPETDTSINDYTSASYGKVINTIGSDWKNFNMETFVYDVSENLVYFAQDKDGNYYKLVFTTFEGSATGNIEFVQTTYQE